MPTYPMVCKCGKECELVCRYEELESKRCECGGELRQDYGRKRFGMAVKVPAEVPKIKGRKFFGDAGYSLTEGCHPADVQKMREAFGDVGHVWQDDGRVKYADKDEARKYAERKEELNLRKREQLAKEGKLVEPEKPKPVSREKRRAIDAAKARIRARKKQKRAA